MHPILVSEKNIPEIIPQRYPMIMIDGLLKCDESLAVSVFTVHQDNLFVKNARFTAPGLMENMAQTAAARTGYLLQSRHDGTNKKPPVGVIGSIKNFRLHFQPPIGSEIVTTLTVEHEVLQALVVKVKAKVDGRLAAESDLQIFITDNQPGKP